MSVTDHPVLKTTPPMIESLTIDLAFPAECGSAQAADDLFAYQTSPACRSFFLVTMDTPFIHIVFGGAIGEEFSRRKMGRSDAYQDIKTIDVRNQVQPRRFLPSRGAGGLRPLRP